MSEKRRQIITVSEPRRRKRIVFYQRVSVYIYRSLGKGKERNKSLLATKIIPYWKMSKVEFAYHKLLLASGWFKNTLEAAAECRDVVGICTSLAVGLSVQADSNYPRQLYSE